MSLKYAKDQPAGFNNRIERVAIVGASGHVGKPIVEHILKTGKHTITAITRKDSKSVLPAGIDVVSVDYDDSDALVAALQGVQFFIISLSVVAPPGTHLKLVTAAAKAGVPWVLPNTYTGDLSNLTLAKEGLAGENIIRNVAEVEATGVSKPITLACNFWYEWSIACGTPAFGIDFPRKKVVFFDDGKVAINTSTWAQCGRAVAALLNLKQLPDDENDTSPTVSQWAGADKILYISSFRVSQRDMLDSINRVAGLTDADWDISYQPAQERYAEGVKIMQAGNRVGFAQAMYVRVFYPNGDGDYETSRGLANAALGLPQEDLDEITRETLALIEGGFRPFG